MIKNCLRSEKDFFKYEIKHNDEVIANAHLLSIRDKNDISSMDEDNKAKVNLDMLIHRALDSWEFADKDGKPLTLTLVNIKDLADEYYMALVTGITNHEAEVSKEAEGIEKN